MQDKKKCRSSASASRLGISAFALEGPDREDPLSAEFMRHARQMLHETWQNVALATSCFAWLQP